MFKRLYKNSGREKGTLRFFREKLNQRNVTAYVKHYEDCEQLFFSVRKCFVIKALLEFFNMAGTKHKPSANGSHSVHVLKEEYWKDYFINMLDKFLDEHVFNEENIGTTTDGVWCYGINILRSFILLFQGCCGYWQR